MRTPPSVVAAASPDSLSGARPCFRLPIAVGHSGRGSKPSRLRTRRSPATAVSRHHPPRKGATRRRLQPRRHDRQPAPCPAMPRPPSAQLGTRPLAGERVDLGAAPVGRAPAHAGRQEPAACPTRRRPPCAGERPLCSAITRQRADRQRARGDGQTAVRLYAPARGSAPPQPPALESPGPGGGGTYVAAPERPLCPP